MAIPIVLLGLLAYSNSFNGPFVFDDRTIEESSTVRDLSHFASLDAFTGGISGVDRGGSTELDPLQPNRPVGYLSFALNYLAHGTSVFGYHVVNLVIHIANALLIFALVMLAFRTPRMRDSLLSDQAPTLALVIGLLFVAHPIQTQAVTYIIQRLASLATFFYLASLVLYVRSRLGTNTKFSGPALYGASLLLALCAMKTKESAITLPVAIFLFELIFFDGAVVRRLLRLAPLLATILVIPLSMLAAGGSETGRLATDMSRLDYLFTQFTVITSYLRLLVLPIGQNLDHDRAIYDSLFQLPVLVSLLFLAGLVVGSVLLLRLADKRPELRFVSFGMLWFFLALGPESSIAPIVDVMFEHRVYLPSVGFFIAVVVGGACLAQMRGVLASRAITVGVVSAVLLLSVSTYARNKVWSSESALWLDVTEKSPNRARGHFNLGESYRKEQNDLARAQKAWERAVELDPKHSSALNSLGNILSTSDPVGANSYYRRAAQADANNAPARYNYARSLEKLRRFSEAAEHYEKFLLIAGAKYRDRVPGVLNSLGGLRLLSKDYAGASNYYHRAVQADPGNVQARYNYARSLDVLGRSAEAVVEYRVFLQLAGPENSAKISEVRARLQRLQ
jgi:Tfp pilus assembly protein PilF